MTDRGTRTLILGGVRSGKSEHGEALLREHDAVRYIATGPATSSDADWVARVAAHRARRDRRYRTVETTDLATELSAAPTETTLIDDLGNWVAARIDAVNGWTDSSISITDDVAALAHAVAGFTGDLVIISPEVGLSPVAPTPAGRRFQDDLGALNTAVAQVCDRVVLMVAGRVIELPDLSELPERSELPEHTEASVATPVPTTPLTATPIATTTVAATPIAATPINPTPIDPTDAEVFPTVVPPDIEVAEAARRHQLDLTKPAGSLGRLEELGVWVASCQSVCPPRPFSDPTVVVFAGDHGVAQGGVSAYPPEVTGQMVANIAAGGAAINVLARRAGASVRVVDMSVDADTAPELSRFKVRRSSGDLRVTDALTIAEARQALAAGRAIVDELVDAGADLLIAGEMGIGNTTPATVLIGTVTSHEPVVVVGRGTGIDDAGWIRKTAAIRDGMRRARKHRHDPLSMLAAIAGADLTAMAGFLTQAAIRRTPVILDGVVVTASALLAEQLAPGASTWWVAGHQSAEPAHALALEHLGLQPILELSMRLGEGSGAMAALPLVASAVDVMTSMATFSEAGVTDRDAEAAATATADTATAPA